VACHCANSPSFGEYRQFPAFYRTRWITTLLKGTDTRSSPEPFEDRSCSHIYVFKSILILSACPSLDLQDSLFLSDLLTKLSYLIYLMYNLYKLKIFLHTLSCFTVECSKFLSANLIYHSEIHSRSQKVFKR
jgi:hypothetical protein